MLEWQQIDTVLLDMDGTLLDLHFDNHFWLDYVPERYAEARGMSKEAAKQELIQRYRAVEGSLDWYCVDYWSKELALDIPLLKQEVEHLIAVHPFVLDFLALLQKAHKTRILVTNAHQKALDLKMRKTRLGDYLDQVISAHEIGLPKENPDFWRRLGQIIYFDPEHTLIIDDNEMVLQSAQTFGIRYLLQISHPDAQQEPKTHFQYPAVPNFSSLLPDLKSLYLR